MPVPRPSAAPLTPTLPGWVGSLVPAASVPGGRDLTVTEAGDVALVSGRLAEACSLAPERLRAAVADLYERAGEALRSTRARHVVRVWNFIPGIHEPMGAGLTRYFVFNQGRFDAFTKSLGGAAAFDAALPTATGIGHDGADLVLHFLGSAAAGRPLENPRQQPAYRYSARHGPRPPCFARATRVRLPIGNSLLVGGTAAVRGEESMHSGSLEAQVDETVLNLGALLGAAGAESLHAFTHARVYYLRPEDRGVLDGLTARFHPACDVEFVRADICRRELLVEIEGLARLPEGP
jgi:hypothetical protein